MNSSLSIAVVIPVFNEGNILKSTITRLLEYRDSISLKFQIILVDDGSSDGGFENISEMSGEVIELVHDRNKGQGAALATGLEYVKKNRFDIMVHFDADGQHSCKSISTLIEPIISNEVDVVLGSRFLLKSSMDQIPYKRRLLLKLALIVDNFLSGIKKTDVHNGLRAFGKRAIENVIIAAPRMEHASEIIWEIKRAKLTYKEVPVDIVYTSYSMSKEKPFAYAWITLFRIIVYYFRYISNPR